MHYKDGTRAAVGDIARGKPYNTPHEVIGEVLQLSAGSSCNLQIAIVRAKRGVHFQGFGLVVPYGSNLAEIEHNGPVMLEPAVEYGTVGEFELVYRPEAANA